MKYKKQDYNDVTVLEMQGEFEGEFRESFETTVSEIITKEKKGIVIDMNHVSFIDSEGLELLLWTRDYCHDNKCQLKIAGLDENCRKILEITRLNNEFDYYTELAEAVMSYA